MKKASNESKLIQIVQWFSPFHVHHWQSYFSCSNFNIFASFLLLFYFVEFLFLFRVIQNNWFSTAVNERECQWMWFWLLQSFRSFPSCIFKLNKREHRFGHCMWITCFCTDPDTKCLNVWWPECVVWVWIWIDWMSFGLKIVALKKYRLTLTHTHPNTCMQQKRVSNRFWFFSFSIFLKCSIFRFETSNLLRPHRMPFNFESDPQWLQC